MKFPLNKALVGCLSAWLFCLASARVSGSQDAASPLPDLEPFLKEVRKSLKSDRLLLCQYTYTQKSIEHTLDGKGNVKKTEEEISEVYPSLLPGLSYERVISRNGQPVPAKEIEKQDREHEKRLTEHDRKLEKEGTSAKDKRLAKEAEEQRKEEAAIDELFRMYDIKMRGRELVDGNSTILIKSFSSTRTIPSRRATWKSQATGRN